MTAFFLRLYRIIAMLLWSAIIAVLSIPGQLTGGWAGVRKISRYAKLWSRGIAKIVNLRVKISGEMPSGAGGLVVSNHLGYLDIITHGSVFPLRHAPKAEIAKWPLLGWYVGLSRPVWVDRISKRASKKIFSDYAETMKNGLFLIVYPEGTSTDGKNGILPFKSASFEAAIAADAPIFPVITRYKEPPGLPAVSWYGNMSLLPHIWQVLKLPSIDAELRFLPPVLPSGNPRKDVASLVYDMMVAEYENLP